MRRGVLGMVCVVGLLWVAPVAGAAGAVGNAGDAGDIGGVSVIYGAAGGLSATATPDQFWTQDSPNVEGAAEAYDEFGRALAAAP